MGKKRVKFAKPLKIDFKFSHSERKSAEQFGDTVKRGGITYRAFEFPSDAKNIRPPTYEQN